MRLSELRMLYEVFEQDRERVQGAIQSIRRGFTCLSDIETEEFFPYEDMFYSTDEYVEDYHGNLIKKIHGFCCEGEGYWFSNTERNPVYIGDELRYYSDNYLNDMDGLSCYRGTYYDDEALDYNNLVYIDDEGEIGRRGDAYWHDEDMVWRSYDKPGHVRGYHNGSYKSHNFSSKSKYKIGYEIEKEDESVRNSMDINEFEEATNHIWRKEKDGSLDDDSGYELISPTFEFNINKIFEHIEGNDVLVDHINADFTKSCGGHIHLSEKGLSGNELFDKIKGYTPLFYALYHGRVDKNYSKGKSNRDLEYDNEKYQAIKIHGDRVEFRIISAVPSVSTLKWRSKLLMAAIQNPTDDVIKAYYNVDTKFTKLLKQVYSDDRLIELKSRFVAYTKQFEGLDIK